ncbi:hypothetical protein [Rothia sp. ZJ932]|uniref:hypothetical protein n=1 Tax=Rothia sp. ZJ932 TaxID=2810516 RepID=UPI00196787A6|nr:hypothetical protein [Rothia sp. ZJ932]QRZ61300.1 hypothetical protein JR346_08660 [Rothia sp. ZJ932]
MSVAVALSPAGVPVIVVVRVDHAQELAQTICEAWESLNPQVLHDVTPLEDESAYYIILEEDNEYYRQVLAESTENTGRLLFMRYSSDEQVMESLVSQITITMIMTLVGKYQMFHAAALGDPETGRALALVAESGTGKTTASRFLGQHLTYLTDETVIVDADYSVVPYLKPLSVIVDPARPKEQISPARADLKIPSSEQSFTLTQLVILARDKSENHVVPRLVPVDMVDALLTITGQTSGVAATEHGVEKLIELINDCGGALRLEYSEIEEALPLVQGLLRGGRAAELVQPPVEVEIAYAQRGPAAAHLLWRGPGSSAYRVDERVLLMRGDKLSEVSFFAGDIWFELEKPLETAKLRQRLEELYDTEIPAEAFEHNITELMNLGVIGRGVLDSGEKVT